MGSLVVAMLVVACGGVGEGPSDVPGATAPSPTAPPDGDAPAPVEDERPVAVTGEVDEPDPEAVDHGEEAVDTVQPPTGDTACGLFTLDEVARVLGRPAVEIEVEEGIGFTDFCSWIAIDETPDPPIMFALVLSISDQTAALWAPELYEGNRQRPVEGFGDEAFVSYDEGSGVTAGVVEGDVVAYLTLSISWVSLRLDQPADDTAEREDEVVELLRLAMGRR